MVDDDGDPVWIEDMFTISKDIKPCVRDMKMKILVTSLYDLMTSLKLLY